MTAISSPGGQHPSPRLEGRSARLFSRRALATGPSGFRASALPWRSCGRDRRRSTARPSCAAPRRDYPCSTGCTQAGSTWCRAGTASSSSPIFVPCRGRSLFDISIATSPMGQAQKDDNNPAKVIGVLGEASKMRPGRGHSVVFRQRPTNANPWRRARRARKRGGNCDALWWKGKSLDGRSHRIFSTN